MTLKDEDDDNPYYYLERPKSFYELWEEDFYDFNLYGSDDEVRR